MLRSLLNIWARIFKMSKLPTIFARWFVWAVFKVVLILALAHWTKEKTLFQKMTYFSTFFTLYLGAFGFDVPFLATVKAFVILGTIYKGQIISECLFDFLNFPKNQRKI